MHEMRNGPILKWNIRNWLHLNMVYTVKMVRYIIMRITKVYIYLLLFIFTVRKLSLNHILDSANFTSQIQNRNFARKCQWCFLLCDYYQDTAANYNAEVHSWNLWLNSKDEKVQKDVLMNVRCCLLVCTITLMKRYHGIFVSKHTINIC